MKISNYLPQFPEANLLITAGKQEARFHVAQLDTVEQVHLIKIKKSQYTDREGRFDKRAAGRMVQSGSVYESQDEELIRTLTKQLAEAASTIATEHKIKTIYLFCPTYLANRMEASLAPNLKILVEYIFYGNYHNQHPFVLLSKIKEYLRQKKDETVEPIKDEALNILKNTASFSANSD